MSDTIIISPLLYAVTAIMGWVAVAKQDHCENAPMRHFVWFVTVMTTLALPFAIAGFCLKRFAAYTLNAARVNVLINFIWLIWGVIAFCYSGCKDTIFWNVSFVFVFIGIVQIFMSLLVLDDEPPASNDDNNQSTLMNEQLWRNYNTSRE